MHQNDFFSVALHIFNILLSAGFVLLCIWLYRFIDKKLTISRKSR
jgi:hypothetical protein